MMIYLVIKFNHDDTDIRGVFSTRERAEEIVEIDSKNFIYDGYHIYDIELDKYEFEEEIK